MKGGEVTDFWIGALGFGQPMVLAIGAFAIAALLIGVLSDWYWRRRLAGRIGELPLMRAMLASVSPGRRKLKAVLLVVGGLGLAIALAEPRIKSHSTIERRGLDLVLAMDVSKSMLVTDVAPSRLDRAHQLADAILTKLEGDRTAAVVFAGGAAHFPLSDDQEVTRQFLFDLGPLDLPVGSDLAEAVRVSRCLLRPDLFDQLGCPGILGRRGHGGDPLPGERSDDDRRGRRGGLGDLGANKDDDDEADEEEEEREQRGRAILIFTDGADEAAKAEQEVAIARQLGISVFVIGFGTQNGGEVWDIDSDGKPVRPKKDQNGRPVVSKRDDDGMRRLAAASGSEGRYLVAAETGDVDPAPVIAALAGVQRGLTAKKIKKAEPVYHWFLFPALMLLIGEALLSTRRRVPDAPPMQQPEWVPWPAVAVAVLVLVAASTIGAALVGVYLELEGYTADVLSPRYQRLLTLWAVVPGVLAGVGAFLAQRHVIQQWQLTEQARPWRPSLAALVTFFGLTGLSGGLAQMFVDPRSPTYPRVALVLLVPVLFVSVIVFMVQRDHRRRARAQAQARRP